MAYPTNRWSEPRSKRPWPAAAVCALVLGGSLPAGSAAQPLEEYVGLKDDAFVWTVKEIAKRGGGRVAHLEFTSQEWRGTKWEHHLRVFVPERWRHPETVFLYVTGDGSGRSQLAMLELIAERAGVAAAVVTQVPNQPLYDGRKEDALIAYTFDQYLKSGDRSWPLLFPMVKSAVKAMDAVTEWIQKDHGQKVEGFIVAGASKRGWTTWLTAAVDPRVKGIAPMVIDMLNIEAQTAWTKKVYGRQSEKIRDYTELNLVERIGDPRMVELRSWVDPFAYRGRYTMPKLILLGTNDPYWVVDSLRHYWNDLPEPKLLYQTPNAGHDLGGGKEATQTLAAFVQMIADGQPLPRVTWEIHRGGAPALSFQTDQPAREMRLWSAQSKDRDFRDERWRDKKLAIEPGSSRARAELKTSGEGYHAYLGEVLLRSATGHDYRLSTEAGVIPDGIREGN